MTYSFVDAVHGFINYITYCMHNSLTPCGLHGSVPAQLEGPRTVPTPSLWRWGEAPQAGKGLNEK